jgi:hypothetical protein
LVSFRLSRARLACHNSEEQDSVGICRSDTNELPEGEKAIPSNLSDVLGGGMRCTDLGSASIANVEPKIIAITP